MKSNDKLVTYGIRVSLVGLTILIISMIASGFNFRELTGFFPNEKDQKKSYPIYDVKNINLNLSQADLEIKAREDKRIGLTYESLGKKFTSELRDGNLEVNIGGENPQLDLNSKDNTMVLTIPLIYEGNINVSISKGDISYVAESLSENVKLFTGSGNIEILDSNFRDVANIKSGSGQINIYNSSSGNFNITSSNGNIGLERLDVKNNLNIRGNQGLFTLKSISVNNCDITINQGTLDINTSSIYEDFKVNSNKASFYLKNTNIGKNLLVQSTEGSQKYKDIQGKRIDLSSTRGNIEGSFIGTRDLYNLEIKTNGDIQAPSTRGFQEFNISSNMGNVRVEFTNPIVEN